MKKSNSSQNTSNTNASAHIDRRQACQLIAAAPFAGMTLTSTLQAKEAKKMSKMPKVLLPIGDGSEVLDTMYAYYRIKEDDYEIVPCGPETRHYHLLVHERPPNSDVPWDITRELAGYHLKATIAFKDINPRDYVGLYVSGGRAPEYLRYDKDLLNITKYFLDSDKPVASLCHGIEILSASGAMKGRKATTIPKCALDVEQGGATYTGKFCTVDGNLVTAQGKKDLHLLLRQFMKMLNASVKK